MGITEIAPNKLLLAYDRRTDDSEGAARNPDKCYIGSAVIAVEKVAPGAASLSKNAKA
jgi:hypothetical protein